MKAFQRVMFLASATLISSTVFASGIDDAKGLWLTAEKDAVIEVKVCPDKAGGICGKIVWDREAGTATDTCGVQIAQLSHYDNEAWRDGWIYDPRDKKKYKGTIRVKDGVLTIRAYIGMEMLGEDEQLTHVAAIPTTPACSS
jgi:uncharacterized protein (DUF2147 family)